MYYQEKYVPYNKGNFSVSALNSAIELTLSLSSMFLFG